MNDPNPTTPLSGVDPHSLVRRLGRFRVSQELVMTHPDGVMKALAECLIVRCEMRYATMTFDYEAMSPHFAECHEWCVPPEYEAIMETVNTGTDEDPVWEVRLKGFRPANAEVRRAQRQPETPTDSEPV